MDSPCILLVDHEQAVRNSLSRLLRRHGFDVATAGTGQKALNRLRKGEQFGCILLDLILPDMRTRELIEMIQEESLIDLDRLVILTSVHNVDNATAYLQMGVSAYCGKPFDNQRMVEQIRRACRLPSDTQVIQPVL